MELTKCLLEIIKNESEKIKLKSCDSLEEIYEKCKEAGFKGTYCEFEEEYAQIFLNIIEKVSEDELKVVSGGVINRTFSKTLATTLSALSISGAVLPSAGATENYPFANKTTSQNKVLKFIKENPKKSIGALISALSVTGIGVGVGVGVGLLHHYNKKNKQTKWANVGNIKNLDEYQIKQIKKNISEYENKQIEKYLSEYKNKNIKNVDELIAELKNIIKDDKIRLSTVTILFTEFLLDYFSNGCKNKKYINFKEVKNEVDAIIKAICEMPKSLRVKFIEDDIIEFLYGSVEAANYKGSNDIEKLSFFIEFYEYAEKEIKEFKNATFDETTFLQYIRRREIKSDLPQDVIDRINRFADGKDDSIALPFVRLFVDVKDKNVISDDFFDSNNISVYGINKEGKKISTKPKAKKELKMYTGNIGEAYFVFDNEEKDLKLEFDSKVWDKVELKQNNIVGYFNKKTHLIALCAKSGLVMDKEYHPQFIKSKGGKSLGEFLSFHVFNDDSMDRDDIDTVRELTRIQFGTPDQNRTDN